MPSTTTSSPTYYELLGLSPTASSAEIDKAFERAVSSFRPRPFGSTASASVAYATLRDPAKRRTYDASIGIQPKPEPKMLVPTRVELKFQRGWAHAPFMAAAPALDRPEPARRPLPEAPPEAAAQQPPLAEQRESVKPALSISEQVEALMARSADPDSAPAPFLSEWSRPGLTIAALLFAAAAIGAFAGLKSVESIDPQQPAQAATVGLPAAKPGEANVVEVPEAQTPRREAAPKRAVRTSQLPATARPKAPADALAAIPADSITESIQVVQADTVEPAVDGAAQPQIATATLPIAKHDIARTIRRIGYSCGSVDSAVPVEGSGAGVFKVTCSSGASYRAAPIRGRYHFRKWDRR